MKTQTIFLIGCLFIVHTILNFAWLGMIVMFQKYFYGTNLYHNTGKTSVCVCVCLSVCLFANFSETISVVGFTWFLMDILISYPGSNLIYISWPWIKGQEPHRGQSHFAQYIKNHFLSYILEIWLTLKLMMCRSNCKRNIIWSKTTPSCRARLFLFCYSH